MLLKKLFRTLWHYKAQFISMVLMIALGIGVFLGFNIEWYSLEKNLTEIYEATDFADYRIYAEQAFSEKDLQAVLAVEGVEDATRYLSVITSVKDSEDTLALTVVENPKVSGMLVTSGQAYDPESPDGIWLSDSYAVANGISVGDSVNMIYKMITVTGTVKGMVKSSEYLICLPDETRMMPDYSSHGYAFISPKMLDASIPAMYRLIIGDSLYMQLNVKSSLEKADFVEKMDRALGRTLLVLSKDETISWAEAQGEVDEGKTMGSILPVLFLAIAILTMVTTMHRITVSEKTQIGTLKALGFRDDRILRHYTSYALIIGILGSILGIQFLALHLDVYPEDEPQEQHGEDYAHNSQRISNGISGAQVFNQRSGGGRTRVSHALSGSLAENIRNRLLGRSKTRSIGNRTLHHSYHGKERGSGNLVNYIGAQAGSGYDQGRPSVKGQTSFLERGEEVRSDRQAYGIYKENETEVLDKRQNSRIGPQSKVRGNDPYEKNPCRTKGEALDLEMAYNHSCRYHNRDDKQRMGHPASKEKIIYPRFMHNSTPQVLLSRLPSCACRTSRRFAP